MPRHATLISTVGRVLIGLVFVMSGLSKLAAAQATQAYIASVGLPAPVLGYVVAIAVEAGAGALLLVGFQTRLVAAVLAAFTLATAIFVHNNFADQNTMVHFLKNLMIIGGLFQIVAFGPSRFSLDARRERKKAA